MTQVTVVEWNKKPKSMAIAGTYIISASNTVCVEKSADESVMMYRINILTKNLKSFVQCQADTLNLQVNITTTK